MRGWSGLALGGAGLSLCPGGEQEPSGGVGTGVVAAGGVGTGVVAGMLGELVEAAAGDRVGGAAGAVVLPELGEEAAGGEEGEAAAAGTDTD